jgi:hypothetical protein
MKEYNKFLLLFVTTKFMKYKGFLQLLLTEGINYYAMVTTAGP